MAAMGADGMKEAATQSTSKAHYLMDALKKAGLKPMFSGEFFNEFITDCPCGSDKLLDALAEKGILGGLPLTENVVLWCTTEMNTKEEMDQVASIVAALISGKEA
jgi:glycine dehydrogenase subunit 1